MLQGDSPSSGEAIEPCPVVGSEGEEDMNKPKARTEKAKAIKAFNQYIRERDGYQCFICGAPGDRYSTDAGHLITSAREATRFDELNTHCSCKGCNIKHELDYEPYRRAFVEKYGEAVYDELYQHSFEYVGRRAQDYIEIRQHYERKLAALRADKREKDE